MGSKGLWQHILGTVIAPKPYKVVNKVAVLSDRKTEATEEQIELIEAKLDKFE